MITGYNILLKINLFVLPKRKRIISAAADRRNSCGIKVMSAQNVPTDKPEVHSVLWRCMRAVVPL